MSVKTFSDDIQNLTTKLTELAIMLESARHEKEVQAINSRKNWNRKEVKQFHKLEKSLSKGFNYLSNVESMVEAMESDLSKVWTVVDRVEDSIKQY